METAPVEASAYITVPRSVGGGHVLPKYLKALVIVLPRKVTVDPTLPPPIQTTPPYPGTTLQSSRLLFTTKREEALTKKHPPTEPGVNGISDTAREASSVGFFGGS